MESEITLIKLEETFEKEEYVISLQNIKKQLELLLFNINDKLKNKGFQKISDFNKIEEIPISLHHADARHTFRYSFPMKTLKLLNLDLSKEISLKFKVTSVKYKVKNE